MLTWFFIDFLPLFFKPLATVHHLGINSSLFDFMALLERHREPIARSRTHTHTHTRKHTQLLGRGWLFWMMDATLSPVNIVPLLLLIAQSESWNICYCGAVRARWQTLHKYTHTHRQTHAGSHQHTSKHRWCFSNHCLIGGEQWLKDVCAICTQGSWWWCLAVVTTH